MENLISVYTIKHPIQIEGGYRLQAEGYRLPFHSIK